MQCPVCTHTRVDRLVAWRPPYSIMGCGDCGLRFCNPLPSEDELTRFYQGFMFRKPDIRGVRGAVHRKKRELERAFGAEILARRGSLLDYGGGTGAGVAAAADLGLDPWYFDVDQQAAEFVRQTFGLPPKHFLDRAGLAGRTFRFILADNVIEHVPDPTELLARLYGLLEPGGMLVVKTPAGGNTTTWFYPQVSLVGYVAQAWRTGGPGTALRAWFTRPWHCDPPRHLWSFTKASMRLVAEQAGIPAKSVRLGHYALPLFEYLLSASILNPRLAFRSLRSAALRVAALPVVPLELALKALQVLLGGVGILMAPGLTCRVVREQA